MGELHGVPVLLKDNIATKYKLNTSAGSEVPIGASVGGSWEILGLWLVATTKAA